MHRLQRGRGLQGLVGLSVWLAVEEQTWTVKG